MRHSAKSWIAAVPAVAALGCGPGLGGITKALAPSVDQADNHIATCEPARDPMNPFIVEWPAAGKTALDVASQSGVVVVSYAGCTLKVLEACEAGGGYSFKSSAPQRDELSMHDASDVYASLPLGAAELKGKLKHGSKLELIYTTVGQRIAAGSPAGLKGQCDGATHYVRAITVGSFKLTSAADVAASAAASGFGASGGAGVDSTSETLRDGGGQCEKDGSGCVALQLGLAPLDHLPVAPDVGSPGKRVGAWVMGGVGVAAVGVGTSFGIRAASQWSERNASCGANGCKPAGVSAGAAASTSAWGADIGIGAGVLALGIGTYLFVSSRSTAPKPSGQATTVHLAPVAGAHGAGFAAAGTW